MVTAAVRSKVRGVRRLEYEFLEERDHVFSNMIFPHLTLNKCFSHSFNNNLLSIYYMPVANLGAYNAVVHRIEKTPILLELNFREEERQTTVMQTT